MGIYESQILPRIIATLCGSRQLAGLRARAVEGLSGRVVEVGFGSGLNLPHLPPAVRELVAIEPAAVGLELARDRVAASPVPVEFAGLDGADLPLPEDSVDGALSTFTLCTIPDVGRALSELRRVLRPGGRLHVLEHGLSPEPAVARWQHRLTPLQRRCAGGCHLDRPIDQLLTSAGFELEHLERSYLGWPRSFTHLYLGVARRPG